MRSASIGSWPELFAEPQGAHRHRRGAPAFRRARRRACRRGGRDRQSAPGLGAAGRRHHVGEDAQRRRQRHPARQQYPKVAAENGGSMIAQNPADQAEMPERLDDRGAHAGPSQQQPGRRGQRDEADAQRLRVGREKIGQRQKAGDDRIELGVEVAQHGGELRQHESEEESQDARRRRRARRPDSAARRRPCGAAPRRARARSRAPRARGRDCRRSRRPGQAPHTSAETAPGDAPARRRSSRRRGSPR